MPFTEGTGRTSRRRRRLCLQSSGSTDAGTRTHGTYFGKVNISEATYNNVSPVGSYNQFDSSYDPSVGFEGEAFEDDNQVVVAFRGTDQAHPINFLLNGVADASWALGSPTPTLETEAADAASFLEKVRTEDPYANITITGHS